jgi:hypothetical protein
MGKRHFFEKLKISEERKIIPIFKEVSTSAFTKFTDQSMHNSGVRV